MHVQRSILALAYLQYRIIVNWIRRSLRSILIWGLIITGITFAIAARVFGGGGGGGESPPPPDTGFSQVYFEAGSVLMFLITVLFAVWKGTGPPPKITQAEVIMVLGSPIKARIQFAWLMFRDMAALVLFISTFTLFALASSIIDAMTAGESSLDGAFSSPAVAIWLIVLIGGATRFTTWVATEQVVARDPEGGHQLRNGIRAGVITIGAAVAGWLLVPTFRSNTSGVEARIDEFAYRVLDLASNTPLVLPANILSDHTATLPALGGMLLLLAIISGFGIYHAKDFVEPIAITAERSTDARGQSVDTGKDLHWSSMSQLGKAPRLSITIPPFGSGPWALLWNSMVRWARYEIAVAGVSILVLAGMGLGAAILARLEIIDPRWIWMLALSMPLFGSYNMFLDELRKPFIFMLPGPPWKRLLAAGATSVMDGTISAFLVALIALVLGVLPLIEAVMILVAATAIGFLIQAGIGLVQVILPTWLNKKLRTSLTFAINTLAIMPAAIATVIGVVAGGENVGYLAGVVTAVLSGIIVLGLAVKLFDRLEMPV